MIHPLKRQNNINSNNTSKLPTPSELLLKNSELRKENATLNNELADRQEYILELQTENKQLKEQLLDANSTFSRVSSNSASSLKIVSHYFKRHE